MNILWRLHTSPYFPSHFRNLEEKLAQKLGLAYHEGKSSPIIKSDQDKLIVITNTHCKLPEDLSQSANNIELLIHANSGFDNISYEWSQSIDFPIILGNPIRAHGVANMILSHLFNHFSPLHHQKSWDKSRTYDRKLLKELSVLILGYGNIGQILERVLTPLCGTLTILDPLKNMSGPKEHYDIVIPVPSLNQSSLGMIDELFLTKQSEELVLINSSRGPIVKEDQLLRFLKSNPKATAYLDVFENEPTDFSKLELKNLNTTSHIAGVSKNLYQESLDFIEKVIHDFQQHDLQNFTTNYKDLHLQQRSHKDFL